MKTQKQDLTGANRANRGGSQNLCSLRSLLFKSGPGGVVQLDFDKSASDGVNIYAKRPGGRPMKTQKQDLTGANRGNRGGSQNLCSLRSLLFKSGSGGVVQLDFDNSTSNGVNIYPKRPGGKPMKTQKNDLTGANRDNRGRSQNLCSLCSLLFKSGSGARLRSRFHLPGPRHRLALHRQPPVARRHQTRAARIQVRVRPERRRNRFVQRRGRGKLRALMYYGKNHFIH